jgi:hypothetical protein
MIDNGAEHRDRDIAIDKLCVSAMKFVGPLLDDALPLLGRSMGRRRRLVIEALDKLRGEIGAESKREGKGGVEDGSGVGAHIIMIRDLARGAN